MRICQKRQFDRKIDREGETFGFVDRKKERQRYKRKSKMGRERRERGEEKRREGDT